MRLIGHLASLCETKKCESPAGVMPVYPGCVNCASARASIGVSLREAILPVKTSAIALAAFWRRHAILGRYPMRAGGPSVHLADEPGIMRASLTGGR